LILDFTANIYVNGINHARSNSKVIVRFSVSIQARRWSNTNFCWFTLRMS